MDPYRKPAVLPPIPVRSRLMLWAAAFLRVGGRYVAGVSPLVALVISYHVGRLTWVHVLGWQDVAALEARSKCWNGECHPRYVFIWLIGALIVTSLVWAPRLGRRIVNAFYSKEGT